MNTDLFLLGLAATLGQILFLRELIVLFSGNEITLGITLASWLLGTGLGSLCIKWVKRLSADYFFFCFFLLSLILPSCIAFIRLLKPFLGLGEVQSVINMLWLSPILIFPYALFIGALFTIGCACLKDIWQVYLFEALGAGIGGFCFYFFLCPHFQSLQIALFLSLFLAIYTYLKAKQPFLKIVTLLLVLFVFFSSLKWQDLENLLRRQEFRPYKPLVTRDTIYGQLTFLKEKNQIILYENGLYSFTYPDLATVEPAIHFPLLQHSFPSSVLLIGGGVCGGLKEVLKHSSVKEITYVELDSNLIALSKRYLPGLKEILKDQRISIVYKDGRLFVKKAKRKYDVIILSLPDPVTIQLNRFYTKEFFEEIKGILNEKGVFSLSISSAPDIIGLALGKLLRSIYATLKTVFAEIVVFPGDSAFFFASPSKGVLTNDVNVLIKRIRERGLKVKYVQDYYLRADLSPLKIAYFESILNQAKGEINTDLRPRCYFYELVLISSTHFPFLRKMLLKCLSFRIYHFGIVILILTLTFVFLKRRFYSLPLLNVIGIVGFTAISLEIIVLISFQTFYGYVYQELALLITAFMLGLALGSLSFYKLHLSPTKSKLLLFQTTLSFLCLFWCGIIYLKPHFYLVYSLFLGSIGAVSGIQFLTTACMYQAMGKKIQETAANLYFTDLLGSALGAFLTSIFFLPILGINHTLILLVLLNLMAILVSFLSL
jgi:spermidine synthase